jgi:hypothetical protein
MRGGEEGPGDKYTNENKVKLYILMCPKLFGEKKMKLKLKK